MIIRPLGALLLSAVALLTSSELKTIPGTMWAPANVRSSVTPREELRLGRQLLCAAEAGKRSWCSLYCYVNGHCALYSASFPATSFNSSGNCKTSLKSLECTPPFAPVNWLEDLGCLYLNKTLSNWYDSRQNCFDYKADLVCPSTPEQYSAFYDYCVASQTNSKWSIHVGMKARKWLDGRPVVEWGSDQPNDYENDCGSVWYISDGLYDYSCTHNMQHVCQANATGK